MRNKIFKHLLFTLPQFFFLNQVFAQNGPAAVGGPNGLVVNSDLHQIYLGKYSTSGKLSPYLYNEFKTGSVKMKDGRTFENLNLLYDQINDKVYFSEDKNQLKEFTDTVKEFSIIVEADGGEGRTLRIFKSGYPNIDKNNHSTYYEILVEGSASLLFKIKKGIVIETSSNAIHKTKQIAELSKKYYLTKNDVIISLKKDITSLLPIIGDKSKDLDSYASEHKLNLRNQQDLVKLITYYNQLLIK